MWPWCITSFTSATATIACHGDSTTIPACFEGSAMMSFGDYLPHGLSTSSRKTSTPKGAGSAPPRRYLRAMLLEAIRAQDNRLHTPHASREPLPWYLVLGASSSGKTTLLCTLGTMVTPSTLPPHSSEGSTFACMWWPCAEAIFLETAGYYVTPAEEVHHRTE